MDTLAIDQFFDPSAIDMIEPLSRAGVSVVVTDDRFEQGGPHILYVNEAFEAMTGYCGAEVIGLSPRLLQGPKTDKAVFSDMRETLENNAVWSGETVNYRKDGTPFWMNWSITNAYDRNGKRYFLAVQRDTTPMHEAEAIADKNRETLALALDMANTGYWELDFTNETVNWSRRVYEIFGIEPETELSLAYINTLIHPDDIERVLSASRENRVNFHYRIIRPNDGEIRHIFTRLMREFGPQGEKAYVFGIHQDITEQVRIEEQLREQTAELAVWSRAVNIASEGMAITDSEGHFLYVNRAYAEMYGYDAPADLMGLHWHCLFDPQEAIALEERSSEALCSAREWRGEVTARSRDGSDLLHEAGVTLMDDGGVLIVCRDISEHRRMEREAEALRAQFYQSQKMEAVGRLAGGIAHDFNNILSSMLGYTALLLEDLPPDSEQREFARQISIGGERASHLVKQILAYSRRGEEQREYVALSAIIAETEGMLRTVIPRSIDFSVKPYYGSESVYANRTQLSQVLMNLAVNGRDAIGGDHGRVVIEIDRASLPAHAPRPGPERGAESVAPITKRTINGWTEIVIGRAQPSDRYVRICVSDSGCGIDPAILEKIFDPFFTTKGIGKGTGLGLPAVQGIVAAHGGIVAVSTRQGEGTRVSVFLPLLDDAPDDEAVIASDGLPKVLTGEVSDA